MVKIIGAKGIISDVDLILNKIEKISKKNNLSIQLFDAKLIFGKDHLISSFNHAKRSMDAKTNTTNSLAMEMLLYSSGERQLKIAIPKMGIKKGEVKIAIVFLDNISDEAVDEILKELSLIKDDKVLEGDINTLKKFGIRKEEIETVAKSKYGDLILEKVAMVDIIK
jgi:KEOPS complex subunit Cgi121